jgi:hypothetical protein
MATRAAITEASPSGAHTRARGRSGPDRLTVALLALAGFLTVLALLAAQLNSDAVNVRASRAIVLRRVYETRVVETISGPGSRGGRSVTQSVSSSGSSYTSGAAPSTRSS